MPFPGTALNAMSRLEMRGSTPPPPVRECWKAYKGQSAKAPTEAVAGHP